MIYFVLRAYCRVALWINFRKVYLEDADRIPEEPTVLFGLNHPTAFLDPIILGTHVDPWCWYMLRGDKFVNAPVRWGLRQIRNLPIWRGRDAGRSGVQRNLATMDFATDRLLLGEPTIILSEGLCRHERRLRPIQRGTARMMFQAYRKDPSKPVAIVPSAINYTAPNEFRSSVYLSFGEPIYAADYAEDYRADKRETIDAVTAELERRLRELVVHVEDPRRDDLADRIVPLVTNAFPDRGYPPVGREAPARAALHRAVERLNAMDAVALGGLTHDLERYDRLLATSGVTDEAIANLGYGSAWRALLLLITGPLAVLGLMLNYPLAVIAHRQTVKRVSNLQFFASVRWGIGLGLYLAVTLAWTVALAFAIGWFALLVPLVFGLTGYFALLWYESFDLWRKSARLGALADTQLEKLTAMRAGLLATLGVRGPSATPAHLPPRAT